MSPRLHQTADWKRSQDRPREVSQDRLLFRGLSGLESLILALCGHPQLRFSESVESISAHLILISIDRFEQTVQCAGLDSINTIGSCFQHGGHQGRRETNINRMSCQLWFENPWTRLPLGRDCRSSITVFCSPAAMVI